MGYDTRIVAFIDILGFKNAVDKSNNDETEYERILCTLTELRDFFIKPMDNYEIKADRKFAVNTQILQVSDSLIISRLVQDQGGVYYMLSDCAFAIHLLIRRGFLCKGAIRIGNMYHKETTLFGQAFVDAYLAEEEEKLPIIKFDEKLFGIVEDFPGLANVGFEDWEIAFIKKNCKQLENGEYYIDYFTDYDDRVGGDEGSASEHYSQLRKIIVNGLNLPKDSSAYKKYLWAKVQFNITANNFGLAKIEGE